MAGQPPRPGPGQSCCGARTELLRGPGCSQEVPTSEAAEASLGSGKRTRKLVGDTLTPRSCSTARLLIAVRWPIEGLAQNLLSRPRPLMWLNSNDPHSCFNFLGNNV